MVLSIPSWAFALLPLAFFVAALFWGAPAVALVSELIGAVTGKPFPARCARQISALAVRGHALGWMCVLIAGGVLWSGSFWQSPWATGNRLMLILAMALPLCGTLALVAYDLGWKGARERRLFHILLGCVANVPIKYGYWGLAGLALLAFRDLPLGTLPSCPRPVRPCGRCSGYGCPCPSASPADLALDIWSCAGTRMTGGGTTTDMPPRFLANGRLPAD